MFNNMIDRSISPGPAMHNSMSEIKHAGQGSKVIPFGDTKRFSGAESLAGLSFTDAGPGEYDTNNVKHMHQRPRTMIPRTERWKTIKSTSSAGLSPPKQYVGHSKMTERRSRSNERNAPRATIGKYDARNQLTIDVKGPGPQNYDTISSRNHIGDKSSTKVCMALAARPISAEPKLSGKKQRATSPGPQDYNTIDVNKYRIQRNVIPSMTIPSAGRSSSAERLRGPGPQTYRANLDIRLRRNPSCTIGNTVREVAESREKTTEKKRRNQSPGPSCYYISRALKAGHGQTIFRQKRSSCLNSELMPGP